MDGPTSVSLSILIAKIVATLYLSIGAGLILNGSYYKKELVKLFDNPGFLLLDGVISMIAGYLVIEYHNVWTQDWRMLITLLGWGLLSRGVFILALPKVILKFKPLIEAKYIHKLITPSVLLMGVIFAYFGFFV